MAKLIPNGETWVGFATTVASKTAPTVANITGATNVTPTLISITASSTGNSVPTPTLDTLFETNIPGTASATFSADFYRDTVGSVDVAYTTLVRGTSGFFLISRFGGGGALKAPSVAGNKVEVWPVRVISRSSNAMTSNTAQTFTVTCAVPDEPVEPATVVA